MKVDINELNKVAKRIENNIESERHNYEKIKRNIEVEMMVWQGKDYDLFKSKWNELMKNESEFYKKLEMIKSYALFLKKCSKEYEKMQNRLINKAKKLP